MYRGSPKSMLYTSFVRSSIRLDSALFATRIISSFFNLSFSIRFYLSQFASSISASEIPDLESSRNSTKFVLSNALVVYSFIFCIISFWF
mmetsp:Transcript_1761/g.198  ORF Transcript_1761/g.198 Transcript_1761/m.198 type:complete len:90 (+) Transcript_1761:2248-2517(+)